MSNRTQRPRKRLSKEQLRAFRRKQVREARLARRQLDRIHQQLPKQVHAVFGPLALPFTRPTHHRFVLLALAAILTLGGRTIANRRRSPVGARPSASRGGPVRHEGPSHLRPGAPTGER